MSDDLNALYLDWMYNIVCDDRYSRNLSYRKLFAYLHDIRFVYSLPMDGNRYEDGIDLRYRFARDNNISQVKVATYLDHRPCSVLEMMVALAIRCEDQIMDDPDVGNRVGQWFWAMIVSLNLGRMTDTNFDPQYVDNVMDIFLNRRYSRNGSGGLFTIKDKTKDMRSIDIWYQMCAYLNELSKG